MGVGGDGTNNEIINGIMRQGLVSPYEITYTLLPFGTGNDWIRTHKIPKNLKAWVRMFKEAHRANHDVGWVEFSNQGTTKKRYFINIAGLAYDAYIVQKADQFPVRRKRRTLYLWLVLKELWGFKSPTLAIEADGHRVEAPCYTVNIGVGNFAGGGMQIVPHGDFRSGTLAITIVKAFPKWRVIIDVPKLFNGKLTSHPYTIMRKASKVIVSLAGPGELIGEVDGELIGEGPYEFGVEEAALKIIVPKRS